MKPTLLYRIASVLFVLFAAAHTYGFLHFVPPSAEGAAVRDAMYNVHFALKDGAHTYGAFYEGFGLSLSVCLLFLAFLAWHLGSLAARNPAAIGALGWALCATQVAQVVVCLIYLPMVPAISSAIIAVCLGAAAWRVRALT